MIYLRERNHMLHFRRPRTFDFDSPWLLIREMFQWRIYWPDTPPNYILKLESEPNT